VTVASRRSGRALKRLGHHALAGYHQLGSCRELAFVQVSCLARLTGSDRGETEGSALEWHINGTAIKNRITLGYQSTPGLSFPLMLPYSLRDDLWWEAR
jgi:hypothetical protein